MAFTCTSWLLWPYRCTSTHKCGVATLAVWDVFSVARRTLSGGDWSHCGTLRKSSTVALRRTYGLNNKFPTWVCTVIRWNVKRCNQNERREEQPWLRVRAENIMKGHRRAYRSLPCSIPSELHTFRPTTEGVHSLLIIWGAVYAMEVYY